MKNVWFVCFTHKILLKYIKFGIPAKTQFIPRIKSEPMDYETETSTPDMPQITIGGIVGSSNRFIDFSLVCKYCNGRYIAPSKAALRKHVSRFHKEEHLKYSKSAEDPLVNLFPCDQCSYRGPSDGALRQHRFRNHNTQRFKCKDCSFRAKDLKEITYHMAEFHKTEMIPTVMEKSQDNAVPFEVEKVTREIIMTSSTKSEIKVKVEESATKDSKSLPLSSETTSDNKTKDHDESNSYGVE